MMGGIRVFNSLIYLSFEKIVNLEVIITEAMNLTQWPDVYYAIIQLLEVLSRLDACLFHTIDTWAH